MKSPNKLRKVTNEQYDIATLESGRLNRMWLLWKMYPYGISGVEPYFKDFLNFWIHHRFGRLIIKYRLMRENDWK